MKVNHEQKEEKSAGEVLLELLIAEGVINPALDEANLG